jgi:hypothetical protein
MYGRAVSTDVPIRLPMAPPDSTAGSPDLSIAARELGPDTGSALYASAHRDADGRPVARLLAAGADHVLSYADGTRLLIGREEIVVDAPAELEQALVDIHLLGAGFALWLERLDTPVLHASVVETGGVAVAFLADGRSGKSVLAAGFLRAGDRLLGDDLLAVEGEGVNPVALPGPPTMRLWPDAAAWATGARPESFDRVHASTEKRCVPAAAVGAHRTDPVRLARIYLPERRAEAPEVEIEPIEGRSALVALVGHSFLARVLAAAGMERRRLGALARIAAHVPVRTLVYPEGLDRVDAVREAVRRDLDASDGGRRDVVQ